MSRKLLSSSPLPIAVAALLTVAFVGCMSETRSLNTLDAGNGGEEGDTPDAGTGGRGVAGQVPGAGTSGLYPGDTGGGPSVGGSAGHTAGGSANAGFGGNVPIAGAPQGGAGSPNGGVPNAGAGALAGVAGFGGFAGGVAGGAGATTCNSSDGTGCIMGSTFCVDRPLDLCGPDVDASCTGDCAHPYVQPICSGLGPEVVPCPAGFQCITEPDSLLGTDPAGICIGDDPPECQGDDDCSDGFRCVPDGDTKRCSPRRADCHPVSLCDIEPVPTCPSGYAPAAARTCSFVCIPYEQCGCTQDADCVSPSVCDRLEGRCRAIRAPEPRCLQPFDPGPCDSNVPAFAFFTDSCKPVAYGGCEGNDNRFETQQECEQACLGAPLEQDCPEGTVAATGCLACGGGGGCKTYGSYCFTKCTSTDDCSQPGSTCYQGICQFAGCL